MKRTKMLTLAIMGSLALAGCAEAPQEPTTYKTVAECTADGKAADICQKSFDDAKKLTEQNAPKFGSLAECQAQFGQNGCTGGSNTQGSFFMPLMMGYMLGNMMGSSSSSYDRNRSGYSYAPPRPVYRTATGGTQAASFVGGRYTATPAAPSYAARVSARSTASTTSSRGGFGGRSAGSSSS